MKKTLVIILSFLIFSCKKDTEITHSKSNFQEIEALISDTIERFTDSINFGIKTKNKIDIFRIEESQNTFVKIYLYEKNKNKWKIKDSLKVEGDKVNILNTEISDFNNDKLNDIIFTSGTSARGGNNVQTLILYKKDTKKLNWIKNSDYFPNLMYNEKLDCIDSFILTGGNTTCFLKIKNDSLFHFASVDQRDNKISIEILDENGKWKKTQSVEDNSEDFKRFIDFNPIEER